MPRPNLTRRKLLSLIGAAGGSLGVWHAAHALELMTEPSKPTSDRFLSRLSSHLGQPHVVIIGAGIGGLSAAFELEQAGYRVTLLEASHRVGGRNFTVRRGTVIDELGNRQVCDFDDDPDLFFNAGPARIPAVHHRLMNYCREFRIQLEPFTNTNYNAWVVDSAINDGERIRQRDVIADARGFIAELAAKGIGRQAMDTPLSDDDIEKLKAYVQSFGDLKGDKLRYQGSGRAGYTTDGMLGAVTTKPHRQLSEIINSRFAMMAMPFGENEYQSPAMMQVAGGTDKIVDSFVANIKARTLTEARVVAIDNQTEHCAITYEHNGQRQTLTADYCLNAIPGHLMQGIDNNFSAAYRQLLAKIERGYLSKIAFQMSRRFWEDEGIYGGISWTDAPEQQIWYPPHGHQRQKGVVLGGYIFDEAANQAFGRMTHSERVESAVAAGEALHPGQYRRHIERSASVAWHRMNHMLGCGHGVGSYATMHQPEADKIRDGLLAGEGRHFMIGDQVSRHPGWQEGALAVTDHVLKTVQQRVAEAGMKA